jgi:hypothetical protein
VNREPKYMRHHEALRRRLAPRVAAGLVLCVRCGEPILAEEPWDLGHIDGGGPRDYSGPEHQRCNRATAGRRIRRTRAGRKQWSRNW